jgi:DNA-binding FadR family transcriptional regulator
MQANQPYRASLVDQIAEKLRGDIVSGKLKPGEFLPAQKDLAAEFNVGLSTILQATNRLTALGLIDSQAGKGTWVRSDLSLSLVQPEAIRSRLDDLNARELCEARFAIELVLTRLAAERAAPKELRAIRQALADMEAQRGEEEFVEADLAFHLAVAKAGHNRLLEQFYHVTRQLLSEVIAEMVRLPGVHDESLVIQTAIADALDAHDADKAYAAAKRHMRYIGKLLDRYD